jgi:hypothetical protein
MCETPLTIAAEFGHIDVVTWLLDAGADIEGGRHRALGVAACGLNELSTERNLELVRLLLDRGAKKTYWETNDNNEGEDIHFRFIDLVCQYGQPLALRELLAHSVAPEKCVRAYSKGDTTTPLMMALSGLENDSDSYPPTYRAAERAECIHILLAYGADAGDAKASSGWQCAALDDWPAIAATAAALAADAAKKLAARARKARVAVDEANEAAAFALAGDDGGDKDVDTHLAAAIAANLRAQDLLRHR